MYTHINTEILSLKLKQTVKIRQKPINMFKNIFKNTKFWWYLFIPTSYTVQVFNYTKEIFDKYLTVMNNAFNK